MITIIIMIITIIVIAIIIVNITIVITIITVIIIIITITLLTYITVIVINITIIIIFIYFIFTISYSPFSRSMVTVIVNILSSFNLEKRAPIPDVVLFLVYIPPGYRLSPNALNVIVKRYSTNNRISFDDFVACCVRLRALTGLYRVSLTVVFSRYKGFPMLTGTPF